MQINLITPLNLITSVPQVRNLEQGQHHILHPSSSNSFNIPFMQSCASKDICFHWFHSVIQSQELENFLLRAMENVDICIELVRIREFDSSGGRIELYCALVHSVLTMSPVVLQSLAERKRV